MCKNKSTHCSRDIILAMDAAAPLRDARDDNVYKVEKTKSSTSFKRKHSCNQQQQSPQQKDISITPKSLPGSSSCPITKSAAVVVITESTPVRPNSSCDRCQPQHTTKPAPCTNHHTHNSQLSNPPFSRPRTEPTTGPKLAKPKRIGSSASTAASAGQQRCRRRRHSAAAAFHRNPDDAAADATDDDDAVRRSPSLQLRRQHDDGHAPRRLQCAAGAPAESGAVAVQCADGGTDRRRPLASHVVFVRVDDGVVRPAVVADVVAHQHQHQQQPVRVGRSVRVRRQH